MSNLICRGLDADLARLARAERCYYTRYADDICFSTQRTEFPAGLAYTDRHGSLHIGAALDSVLTRHGFVVQPVKTRLMHQTQRQRVTGLVVNEGANVDRRYIRNLRNLLYIWERYGDSDAKTAFARANPRLNWPPKKGAPKFEWVVQGQIQHVGFVKGWTNPLYRELARRLSAVDPSYSPRTLRTLDVPTTVRIYTEGKSDVSHLKAAKAYFESAGDFKNMRFEFPADAARGGSPQLLAHCKALAVTHQMTPCVCVFDRDEDKILREAVGGGDERDYGHNVAAIALKPPPWRDARAPLCIELLYRDDDLKRKDRENRRLYLSAEFNPKGRHATESAYIQHPKKGELVREEVFRGHDGAPIGLAKVAFADAVAAPAPGFEQIDFEGFRPTFELIEKTLARFGSSQP